MLVYTHTYTHTHTCMDTHRYMRILIHTSKCTQTRCNTLQHTATHCNALQHTPYLNLITHQQSIPRIDRFKIGGMLQFVTVCSSVLQRVAVCCSVLQCIQCVAVCWSVDHFKLNLLTISQLQALKAVRHYPKSFSAQKTPPPEKKNGIQGMTM